MLFTAVLARLDRGAARGHRCPPWREPRTEIAPGSPSVAAERRSASPASDAGPAALTSCPRGVRRALPRRTEPPRPLEWADPL